MLAQAVVSVVLATLGQVDSLSGERETMPAAEARLAWFQQLVAARPVREESNNGEALRLRNEPVLRWNSPQAGIDGAVFLWLHAERPTAVVGPFLAPQQGGLYVQFQSLADNALVAARDGEAIWNSQEPGIQWLASDTARPANTERERLAQMRAIARGFRATAVKGPPNYEPGSKWELRLMPRPLYRYSSPELDVIDGALFALALGTDPELFVLIEARLEEDQKVWRYALAPWCESELLVEYKDRIVWERPHLRGWDPRASYFRTGPTAIDPPVVP